MRKQNSRWDKFSKFCPMLVNNSGKVTKSVGKKSIRVTKISQEYELAETFW